MTMPDPWTDAEILRALRLRDAGMKPLEIGRTIGRTRNAVKHKLADVDRAEAEATRLAEGRG